MSNEEELYGWPLDVEFDGLLSFIDRNVEARSAIQDDVIVYLIERCKRAEARVKDLESENWMLSCTIDELEDELEPADPFEHDYER